MHRFTNFIRSADKYPRRQVMMPLIVASSLVISSSHAACSHSSFSGHSCAAFVGASSPLDYSNKQVRYSSAQTPESSANIRNLADRLAKQEFQHVLVVVGAGASVSAGIPDFRTPGTGLYDQLQKYNLPYPEAIFDVAYYRDSPEAFVDLAKAIWPGQEGGPRPTLTHSFFRLLETKGILRRIYTQNIDGLEALGGVSEERLVECHGHFRGASCIRCRTPMAASECFDTIVSGEAPTCKACGSNVKPDIVFFGEELPMRYQELVDEDLAKCDLLLVVGTSLLVMPVAGMPSWVPKSCPRILINRDLVGDFRYTSSDRDLFLQGDCDDSVRKLCSMSGWEKELDDIHSSTA